MRTLLTSFLVIGMSLVIFTGCNNDKKAEEEAARLEQMRMDSIAQWKVDSLEQQRQYDSIDAARAYADSLANAEQSSGTTTTRSTPAPSGGTSTPPPPKTTRPDKIPSTKDAPVKVIKNPNAPTPAPAPSGTSTKAPTTKQTKPGTQTTPTPGGSKSTKPGGVQGKTDGKSTAPSGKTSKPGDIKTSGGGN